MFYAQSSSERRHNLSKELISFLECEAGFQELHEGEAMFTRPQVVSMISKYVKSKELGDGRRIALERKGAEKLLNLLNVKSSDEVFYLTLGSKLKHHFNPSLVS